MVERERRQTKIKDLQKEMRSFSGRDIDDVNADIASLEKEIAQINRKYFNYFYYF